MLGLGKGGGFSEFPLLADNIGLCENIKPSFDSFTLSDLPGWSYAVRLCPLCNKIT